MRQPRVLLADDHLMLREAFARLLQPMCEVVGSVADGRSLLTAAQQLRPDIVLADISMPLLNGLHAARRLKRTNPEIRTIILTISEDPDVAAEAIRNGISGYLLKNSAVSELLLAIGEAMQGRVYVTPLIAKRMPDPLSTDGTSPEKAKQKGKQPSSRQREVLKLLAEGNTMRQIATLLDITPRTVAFHKYGMMKQFRARTSADLVKLAVKIGVA
jgi:DNA-binding NarL/FixJ family response regulator